MKQSLYSLAALLFAASVGFSNAAEESRELAESSSATPTSTCLESVGVTVVLSVLSASSIFLMFFFLLASAFAIIMPVYLIIFGIFEMIASILEASTGCTARRRRELQSGGYVHPELAEGLYEAVSFLEGAIDDMISARSDPVIGANYDAQICELADALSDIEGMLGGSRRALKSKGSSGLYCPGGKSGKGYGYSGKTYSPSPSATYASKSKSSYYITMDPSDTSMPMPKSKSGAAYYTVLPSETATYYYKSAKGGKRS